MKAILCATDSPFPSKTPVGVLAASTAALGLKVYVYTPHCREPYELLSYQYPMLKTLEEINDVRLVKREVNVVFADNPVFLDDADDAPAVWVVDNVNAELMASAKRVLGYKKGKVVLVTTQPSLVGMLKSAFKLPTHLYLQGVDVSILLCAPQGAFQKAHHVLAVDFDAACVLPQGFVDANQKWQSSSLYLISPHLEKYYNQWLLKGVTNFLKYDTAPMEILQIMSFARAVVAHNPQVIPPDYFPYRLYWNALASNCWVIYVSPVPVRKRGVLWARSKEEAFAYCEKASKGELGFIFQTLDELARFREKMLSTNMTKRLLRKLGVLGDV